MTVLHLRVIPRAPRTRVDGERNGAIVIRLAAPPIEGAANDALIAFLAETLNLPRRHMAIVSGQKSRDKRVSVVGITTESARALLLG